VVVGVGVFFVLCAWLCWLLGWVLVVWVVGVVLCVGFVGWLGGVWGCWGLLVCWDVFVVGWRCCFGAVVCVLGVLYG